MEMTGETLGRVSMEVASSCQVPASHTHLTTRHLSSYLYECISTLHVENQTVLHAIQSKSLVDLQELHSLVMPIRSAWKSTENVNGKSDEQLSLSESDFPYLDAKPEVGKKGDKGRRHAGELLLKKRLAGQGYLLKAVLETGVKPLGKRRRARLLTDASLGDDLAPAVPYSTNRKGRWAVESAAQLLGAAAAADQVASCALDAHFGVDGRLDRHVLARHELAADGALHSRFARSQRGHRGLADLSAEKPVEVRYILSRAHPVTKVASGNTFKNKPMARSTKRAQMDISVYSTDGETAENEDDVLPKPQAEEVMNMYRPRQQTYSLADFIQEKSSPVIVRARPESAKEDGFEQVDMPSSPRPVDHAAHVGRGPFHRLAVPASRLAIRSRADWLDQCGQLAQRAELRVSWLNPARTVLQLDGSAVLEHAGRAPLLLLCLAYDQPADRLQLLLNGSQRCQLDVRGLERVCGPAVTDAIGGLDSLLRLVLKQVQVLAAPEPPLAKGGAADCHSAQMSVSVQPLNDYLVMAERAVLDDCLQIIKEHFESAADAEEEEDEDDFEHVGMEELDDGDEDENIDPKWIDPNLDEQVAELQTLCQECGQSCTAEVVRLAECGHSFCVSCLKRLLENKIGQKVSPLPCPAANCGHEFPLSLLSAVFPLPLVGFVLETRFAALAARLDKRVFRCPTGCGRALLDRATPYDQVHCQACNLHFCLHCDAAPHWPLRCAQAATWLSKMECGAEVQLQFKELWSECRRRRTDLAQWRRIAKEARKRVGYKLERQFYEVRRTALQLIENGFAWLYMNKASSPRPANWAKVKAALSALHADLNRLEAAVIHVPHCVPAQVADQMQQVRFLFKKAVQELQRADAA